MEQPKSEPEADKTRRVILEESNAGRTEMGREKAGRRTWTADLPSRALMAARNDSYIRPDRQNRHVHTPKGELDGAGLAKMTRT